MKVFALFLGLLLANFSFAQDLEDRDDSFIADRNKNILKIDIKEPFLQIAAKNCTDFKPASFEGGASAYKELLKKYMYDYLNSDYYTISGDFTFILTIDDKGKVTKVEGTPKIANSQIFFEDMKYVVRRIKRNWSPATCNAKAIISKMKLKMNFSSVTIDM